MFQLSNEVHYVSVALSVEELLTNQCKMQFLLFMRNQKVENKCSKTVVFEQNYCNFFGLYYEKG